MQVIRWSADGTTEHEAFVRGDETLVVDWPVTVKLCPASLVSDQR